MVARARLLQARVLPHGWGDVLRQCSLFLAAYFGYRLARGLVEGRATAAFQHARQLISIERTLHLSRRAAPSRGAAAPRGGR